MTDHAEPFTAADADVAEPARPLGTTTIITPDGPFTVIVDDAETVYASGWVDSPDALLPLIAPLLRRELISQSPGAAAEAVDAYYAGDFDAPSRIGVKQTAGPFIESAWAALRTVRPGCPVTYSGLAARAGRPTAIRGAAQCCVRNAAVLFVPCHRVLRSDGTLGGYRYGLELKHSLLERESSAALIAS